MNLILKKDFSNEEIERAIFEMTPLSPPRPDGFPTFLHQENWSIVGREVVGAIQ